MIFNQPTSRVAFNLRRIPRQDIRVCTTARRTNGPGHLIGPQYLQHKWEKRIQQSSFRVEKRMNMVEIFPGHQRIFGKQQYKMLKKQEVEEQ